MIGGPFILIVVAGFANGGSQTSYVQAAHAEKIADDQQLAAQKALGALPGRHEPEDRCGSDADEERCRVWQLAVDLLPDVPGVEQVRASMSEGIALFDASHQLIARNDGDISPGSLSAFGELSAGQLIPDADLELVWFHDDGGRNSGSSMLTVLKRRGAELVEVFVGDTREWDDMVTTSGGERDGHVTLGGNGVIHYRAPGSKRVTTWRWDAAAFRFVKEATPVKHRFN